MAQPALILPALTLKGVRLRAVSVPMARPLHTRVAVFTNAPLLLIDVETEEGVTGSAYLFGYLPDGPRYMAPLIAGIAAACKGDAVVPAEIFAKAKKRLTLMGHDGLSLIAISGFDMACWDALGKAADLPLARLLGGAATPVPAYNSNGLGIIDIDALGDEALELLGDGGFDTVKLRLGRATLEEDIQAVRKVRDAVGGAVNLPVDFNQCLDVEEALRRCRALDGEGVYWIEEPIVYDDFVGCARIAAAVETPVQIGENFFGPKDVTRALDANACDYIMPDAERIGGVTGWLAAAEIADAAGVPFSSHILPEVSAHLLAVTPTAHLLEYVDWANPVIEQPLEIADGHAVIQDRPGIGIAWNEDAVRRFATEL